MKLYVSKQTFQKYLLDLNYSYKIIQYESMIHTIKSIIKRELAQAVLTNSIKISIEKIFYKDISLEVLDNIDLITQIKPTYLKSIIDSGSLDFNLIETKNKYHKKIRIEAYKLKLIYEFPEEKRDLILSFLDIKKSVQECFNEKNFNLSNKDKEELDNLKTFLVPKEKKELRDIIDKSIEILGFDADLNFIDTSLITNMASLFYKSVFNGNVSEWNTSNVEDMYGMFYNSKFNGDISNWDTSNVTDMEFMFMNSIFNQDISNWDTSNLLYMSYIFSNSKFNGDISKWNIYKVSSMTNIF